MCWLPARGRHSVADMLIGSPFMAEGSILLLLPFLIIVVIPLVIVVAAVSKGRRLRRHEGLDPAELPAPPPPDAPTTG